MRYISDMFPKLYEVKLKESAFTSHAIRILVWGTMDKKKRNEAVAVF